MTAPTPVECPECDKQFPLPTESQLLNDHETQDWLSKNTRPCPSCSVPITKSGGCNHMQCTKCRASFCWACMRLRTNCRAYNCQHGAPYRNAVPELLNTNRLGNAVGDSLLATVEQALNRNTPTPNLKDAALVVTALFLRHCIPNIICLGFQYLGNVLVWIFRQALLICVFFGCLYLHKYLERGGRLQNIQEMNRRITNLFAIGGEIARERQQIAEALRRSMVEQ